uniref:HutD family protein n=1 Tax=Haemonchus placei TaxID=6290 RepID=A0A158QM37_HAEPC
LAPVTMRGTDHCLCIDGPLEGVIFVKLPFDSLLFLQIAVVVEKT